MRSEGGAECRKIQEELSSGDSATEGNGTSNSVGNRNNGNDNNINNNINNGSNGNGNGGMVSGGTTSGSENGKVEMKPDPDANWMNGGIVM